MVGARELNFPEKIHLPHLSCVICHMSCVTGPFLFKVFFSYKVTKLFSRGSVINMPTLSSFFIPPNNTQSNSKSKGKKVKNNSKL